MNVAGRTWALGIPLAQIRAPAVDVYVFEATKDGEGYALTPAPEDGFDTLVAEVTEEGPIVD